MICLFVCYCVLCVYNRLLKPTVPSEVDKVVSYCIITIFFTYLYAAWKSVTSGILKKEQSISFHLNSFSSAISARSLALHVC